MQKPASLLFLLLPLLLPAQSVPITGYQVDDYGVASLRIDADAQHYYLLHARTQAGNAFEQVTVMAKGVAGNLELEENLAAFPLDQYRVSAHLLNAPDDADEDGRDDLTEWNQLPQESPLNSASGIDFTSGAVFIPDRLAFKKLATQADIPGIGMVEEVKFFIKNRDATHPLLYFINSNTFDTHTQFANSLGYTNDGTLMTGSILYHPTVAAPGGGLGVYRFVFQPNNTFSWSYVQKAMELMAANMPFLHNNFCYYPNEPGGVPVYWQEKALYDASRVKVLLEDDLFADIDYVALHVAEGYGLLRVVQADETPFSRDVVLYETLPNDLPRVGGIITTVMQTPLSHVNLRAIQDNVPNAFIRDARLLPGIDSLIGRYVYFKATPENYILRSATLAEVDAHYESIRPKTSQEPVRDLSETHILPLDSIHFASSVSFGVKCANVATLRTLGFPEGTVPDGFGVPFYFYDAFMQYNGLYDQARQMMESADFQTDFNTRIERLDAFRQIIKNAPMPGWMMDALSDMQQQFPPGVPIRCRSSTNNEDLPGFSGAGLYDSKTQHPDEGHISKTIKQVFASTWNLRAFEEREFYRIDHFKTAMGVLVHPNFENELVNGVGVSTDPAYNTLGYYYLNTQVGEDLVTNPSANSIPEEVLVSAASGAQADHFVMTHSNQVPADSVLMTPFYVDQMRAYLRVIHQVFKVLYHAEASDAFAMEIEYKIDANGQLVIKQARPWAGFKALLPEPVDTSDLPLEVTLYPNPCSDFFFWKRASTSSVLYWWLVDPLGRVVQRGQIAEGLQSGQIDLNGLASGAYWWRVKRTNGEGRAWAVVRR